MTLTPLTFLLVCPLVFLAGFVDAVAGGGGIISLPAYLMAGLPVHMAAATNKTVNCVGTMVAAVQYWRSGKVKLQLAVWAAVGALVGSGIGTRLALLCSEELLNILITTLLPIVAAFLMAKKNFGTEPIPRHWSTGQERALALVIGLVIGCYDGLIGPGTGTFMIMAFTALLGTDLLTSSGCAKVANLASNVASAVVYAVSGNTLWLLAFPAMACNVLGNVLGTRYAIRGGSRKIRGMMLVVLALLFAKMIYETVTGA